MIRMPRTRWIVVGLVLAGLAVTIGFLMAPRPVPVDIEATSAGPIAEAVADQGAARVREAYIVAAPVSGRLERVALEVGDRVEAGRTVVAQIRPAAPELLDPRTRAQAQAQVSAAEAALAAAASQEQRLAAEAERAESEARRARGLAERGVISRQALETAETGSTSARAAARAGQAQVEASHASLTAARAGLIGPEAGGGQAVTVIAPASGYVTRLYQESARPVAMGQPILEIGEGKGLEAAIEFLSQDAVRIREGMPAEIYDWGGQGMIPARVRRVEPQGFTKVSALGVEEQRVLVLLEFTGAADKTARLGPGYRVWGRVFLRQEASALRAPVGALVRADGGWAIYKVARGRARLTPVKVGALTDRDAEILEGLTGAEQVVVFPSDRVRDGVRVRRR